MTFDIAALDAATPAEEGRVMTVLRQGSDEAATDGDGNPITITLRGRYYPTAVKADGAIQARRLERAEGEGQRGVDG